MRPRAIVQIYKINLEAEISEVTKKFDIFAFLYSINVL